MILSEKTNAKKDDLYHLASEVKTRLTKEAGRNDMNLQKLVCQANLLDKLIEHINSSKDDKSKGTISFETIETLPEDPDDDDEYEYEYYDDDDDDDDDDENYDDDYDEDGLESRSRLDKFRKNRNLDSNYGDIEYDESEESVGSESTESESPIFDLREDDSDSEPEISDGESPYPEGSIHLKRVNSHRDEIQQDDVRTHTITLDSSSDEEDDCYTSGGNTATIKAHDVNHSKPLSHWSKLSHITFHHIHRLRVTC